MSEKKKYPVTILRRRETKQAKKLGEWITVVRITYVSEGMAPRTIRILKEDHTEELEKQMIRADIENRLKQKPEAIEV